MTAQKEETSPEFSAAATAPAAMTVSINDAPEAELDEIEVADYEEKDEEDNDIAGEAAAETTVSPLFAGSDEEEDFNKPLFSDSETGQADESDAADDQSPLRTTTIPTKLLRANPRAASQQKKAIRATRQPKRCSPPSLMIREPSYRISAFQQLICCVRQRRKAQASTSRRWNSINGA